MAICDETEPPPSDTTRHGIFFLSSSGVGRSGLFRKTPSMNARLSSAAVFSIALLSSGSDWLALGLFPKPEAAGNRLLLFTFPLKLGNVPEVLFAAAFKLALMRLMMA